jgi:large subunit ribosomal protein L17
MGDASDMAMIELVDFNEIYGKNAEAGAAKKTRRSRRSTGAKKSETATETPVSESTAPEATSEEAANESGDQVSL